MKVSYRYENRATPLLKAARRDLGRRVKEGLLEAAQAALPTVRRYAPGVVQTIFTAKATTTRAYITTAGPKVLDRIAGLLNFGGVVSTRIYPKREGGVLWTPYGFRRVVYRGYRQGTRAARYEARNYIGRSIQTAMPAFEDAIVPSILRAFAGAETTKA